MAAFYVGILVVVLFLVGGVAMSYVPYFKTGKQLRDMLNLGNQFALSGSQFRGCKIGRVHCCSLLE